MWVHGFSFLRKEKEADRQGHRYGRCVEFQCISRIPHPSRFSVRIYAVRKIGAVCERKTIHLLPGRRNAMNSAAVKADRRAPLAGVQSYDGPYDC